MVGRQTVRFSHLHYLPWVDADSPSHNSHTRSEFTQQHDPRILLPGRAVHANVLHRETVETVTHSSVDKTVREPEVRETLVERKRCFIFHLHTDFELKRPKHIGREGLAGPGNKNSPRN